MPRTYGIEYNDARRTLSEWFPQAYRSAATRRLQSKIADTTAVKHILFVGDSNVEGYGLDTKDITRSKSVVAELQREIRSQFDPNGVDDNASYYPSIFGSTPTPDYAKAFVNTGTVTSQSTNGSGGGSSGMGLRTVSMTGTANYQTYTLTGSDFEIWYQAGVGREAIQVTLDGTVLGTTQATARAAGPLGGRTFSTGLTGLVYKSHTIKIAPNSTGTIYIEGVKAYNNGINSGTHVWDSGHGGFRTTDFNTTPTGGQTFFDIFNTTDTVAGGKSFDHIFVLLGVNEALGLSFATRTPAQYQSDLQTFVNNCSTAGYLGGYTLIFAQEFSGVSSATWSTYRSAAKAFVAANSNVDFFDMSDRLPTLVGNYNAGLSVAASDSIHLNDRGAGWVARSVGETVVPEASKALATGVRPGTLAAGDDPRLNYGAAKAASFSATNPAITLSGTQTIDGQACAVGDVVLATSQGFLTTNGPWVVQSTAWTRPTWFANGQTIQPGFTIAAVNGTANAGLWVNTNANVGIVGYTIFVFQRVATILPSTVVLPYAATVTPDGSAPLNTITLTGNVTTMANPINPINGATLRIAFKQDATGTRILPTAAASWGTQYRFPGAVLPVLTTTASKTDYLDFFRNAADTKWDLVLTAKNF